DLLVPPAKKFKAAVLQQPAVISRLIDHVCGIVAKWILDEDFFRHLRLGVITVCAVRGSDVDLSHSSFATDLSFRIPNQSSGPFNRLAYRDRRPFHVLRRHYMVELREGRLCRPV